MTLNQASRLLLTLLLALQLIAPAWAIDPAASMVQAYNKGVSAYRNGQFSQAADYLRRAVAIDPRNTHARYYLAITLDKLNETAEAIPQYQFVSHYARDPKLVSYAQSRLQRLQPTPVAYSPDKTNSMAKLAMASAANIFPAVYQGSSPRIVVPLKSNKNALMVDATLVNDQDNRRTVGTFIIDTGATYTSISREMAEELGLDLTNCEHVRITTANGRIDVPKVTIDRLNVNGLEARNIEATVIDVRPGSSFAGLLGLSFIREFVVTIDPQEGQLIFQRN